MSLVALMDVEPFAVGRTMHTMERSITGENRVRLSMDAALAAGAVLESIALDPGIGFGKTLEHNLTILRRLNEFGLNDRPVLLGVSRKSLIGKITGPAGRKWGTVALTSYARENGVRILRVHDVKENVQALRMTEAIMAK